MPTTYAVDTREDIDDDRRDPKTKKLLRVCKIGNFYLCQRGSKFAQSVIYGLGIRKVGKDEKVQVLCQSRLRMERNCIAAYHEVFNVVVVEGRQ